MNTNLFINITKLSKQLNISRSNAYTLANRADFYPAFRIGERIVSVEALQRWLAEQTTPVSA